MRFPWQCTIDDDSQILSEYSLTMDRVASQHRIKMSAGHCWCLGGRSIAFVLFTLMQRPLSASQVLRRVAASDRQAARVVGVFPLQYINMSSAKSTDLMVFVAERTSGTFLVYSINRSGPRTLPCGTPRLHEVLVLDLEHQIFHEKSPGDYRFGVQLPFNWAHRPFMLICRANKSHIWTEKKEANLSTHTYAYQLLSLTIGVVLL